MSANGIDAASRDAAPSDRPTRRQLLKGGGAVVAGCALVGAAVPAVHAAEDNVIRLALVGCGGRGCGAAVDAFGSPHGPVKLVALADLFAWRVEAAHKNLSARFASQVDVPPERRFVGFDAYRRAIDCLRPGSGDVAMLAGYAGFRPGQLEYAVGRGVNVFMEKSFASDPPGVRRVIAAGEAARAKGLKVAAGLMCRHSRNRQELIRRIRDGQLGEVQLVRACRMEPTGSLGRRPEGEKELFWQIRNFTHFLWVSGGLFAEMDIHQIDEICWVKDGVPVAAHGVGGRAATSRDCGQNLDSFSAELTFADGTRATDVVRYLDRCHNEFATYVHGTKCAAKFSGNVHAGDCRIYKGQRCVEAEVTWKAEREPRTPWQAEWDALLASIRNDRPHVEAERAARSNLAAIMARAAIHGGKVITWEQAMASSFQFCPDIDRMTEETPPPVRADEQGRYPVPVPGTWTEI